MGDHLVWGGECHLHPDYRLAGKARRGSKTLPLVDHRLCYCLLGVRDVQQPDHADLLPRDPGDCRRTADPAVAKSAPQQLPAGQTLHRAGAMVDDGDRRPICGPILGGYISDNYHWGWIFFINVPIGAVVVLLTLQSLRGRETRTEQRRIDGVGLALLVLGIGSLQIMLDRGKELDWFASQEIIVLTVVAVVALSFLIVWELTDDNPIVDLSLFKSRNFTIGCLCISLAYMLYFGAIVLLPQLLQEVYGYTATWAGLASAPVGVIPVLLSPIIGRFAHKLDMRRLVTFSFIMYAVCFYWRAYTFEPGMDFGASAWPQFIQGFAVACFFMPLTTITLSGLPPERMAAASSLSNFMRTLAGSIGTSMTTTMWTNRESLHHAQLTESVNVFNPQAQEVYSQLQGMGMTEQQASGWIAQQITAQGLIISANEIFWLSAGVFIVLLGLIWFAKPPFGAGGGGGGAH